MTVFSLLYKYNNNRISADCIVDVIEEGRRRLVYSVVLFRRSVPCRLFVCFVGSGLGCVLDTVVLASGDLMMGVNRNIVVYCTNHYFSAK